MAFTKSTYPEGEVYEGNFNHNGLKHGIGHLVLQDEAVYMGTFRDGFFSGLGTLIYADGTKYEGEFLNGKFHGLGTHTRHDGMVFEGHFQDGKVCGFGLVTFADKSHGRPRYEGYFEGSKLVRREAAKEIIEKVRFITQETKKVALQCNLDLK